MQSSIMMFENEVKQRLRLGGIEISEERKIPYAVQLRIDGEGIVINCYDSGKCVVQGENADRVKEIEEFLLKCDVNKDKKVIKTVIMAVKVYEGGEISKPETIYEILHND